jgi:DNA-binding transcriptional LysR family regulator
MWLIPRMEAFQRANPEVDIRIDATDNALDLETSDVDLALRYGSAATMPAHALRLFGEQLTPVASPWLLKSGPAIKLASDLAHYSLIEAGDANHTHLEWLSWRRWLDLQGLPKFEAKRWLYFNYAYQMVQAALSGQGIVLARLPLIAESLDHGDLVEPLPQLRMDSPLAYWLLVGPRNAQREEVKSFCAWLQAQAAKTRKAIGDGPDPETLSHVD